MSCAETERVGAYFDRELDTAARERFDMHLATCAACRALLQEIETVRTALRQQPFQASAPSALRVRVMNDLDKAAAMAERSAPRAAASPREVIWRPRSFWLGLVSGATAGLAAAALGFVLWIPSVNPISDDLLSAHLRSLMPGHLIDVVSTDKHTVKPWFSGHADVSPVVSDFESQGYRLIGGRADYFDHQRAAVVIYQHGSHVINVFSWVLGSRALPKTESRNGYHMVYWTEGDVAYCAISDTGWDELFGLTRLLGDLARRDEKG
jgi:anti-sigma factor RsiW